MEEIKNLFIKHFNFYPDIISTTEHVYISPPSRVISSLIELSKFSNKKILRIIITDTYSIHPESCTKQICIPHLLNRGIFLIDLKSSKKELIKKLEEDNKKVIRILKDKLIFSLQENNNYIEIINLYKEIFKSIKKSDSIIVYNDIIKMYTDNFKLDSLHYWLENTVPYGINSKKIRLFLKEAFDILCEIDPFGVSLFGKYLETKNRLKRKDKNNIINIISWNEYLEEFNNNSDFYSVPFEVILYVYSYCGGSHFGNDYDIVNNINKIRNNSNLTQLTKHNKDYVFNIELKEVQFQKVSMIKDKWSLSHKMIKTVDTLPELYILLGQNNLKNKLKNKTYLIP
ncbi:MAG: hypothetical protein AAB913_02520 [Patescibacteria group bacterium]